MFVLEPDDDLLQIVAEKQTHTCEAKELNSASWFDQLILWPDAVRGNTI
jgi:hypothetical protein